MDNLEIQTLQKEIDQNQQKQQEFSPLKLATLTSTVHFIADTLIYPVDTIATRIKVNTEQYRSVTQELKYVMQNQGIKELYRGVSSTFSCSFTPTFIYFLLYENLSQHTNKYTKNLDQNSKFNQALKYSMPFWVAGISEALSLFFYLPFDIVRTRLQINDPQYQYRGLLSGIKDVVQKEGWFRLYRASHLYITVTTLQTSLQFQFYEVLREYQLKKQHQLTNQKQQHMGFKTSLAVTCIASSMATFLANPLDLLQTRYQVMDSRKQKISVLGIVKQTFKQEGVKGFFKGITPRMIYMCGYDLLWMPIYDYYKGKYGVQIDL